MAHIVRTIGHCLACAILLELAACQQPQKLNLESLWASAKPVDTVRILTQGQWEEEDPANPGHILGSGTSYGFGDKGYANETITAAGGATVGIALRYQLANSRLWFGADLPDQPMKRTGRGIEVRITQSRLLFKQGREIRIFHLRKG